MLQMPQSSKHLPPNATAVCADLGLLHERRLCPYLAVLQRAPLLYVTAPAYDGVLYMTAVTHNDIIHDHTVDDLDIAAKPAVSVDHSMSSAC